MSTILVNDVWGRLPHHCPSGRGRRGAATPATRRNAALIAAGFKLMTRQRDGSEALVHVQLHNSPQESAIARRGALQS